MFQRTLSRSVAGAARTVTSHTTARVATGVARTCSVARRTAAATHSSRRLLSSSSSSSSSSTAAAAAIPSSSTASSTTARATAVLLSVGAASALVLAFAASSSVHAESSAAPPSTPVAGATAGTTVDADADEPVPVIGEKKDWKRTVFKPFYFVYDMIREHQQPTSLLLPDETPNEFGERPRTLVVNLNSTLVKTQWTRREGWRVRVRPGCEKFLTDMFNAGYEIVLFSSDLQFAVEEAVGMLDKQGFIRHRLWKRDCTYKNGLYIKDLSRLNRDLRRVIMVDHDDEAGLLQPRNHICIREYDDDMNDRELARVGQFLECLMKFNVVDVRPKIEAWNAAEAPRTLDHAAAGADVVEVFAQEQQELTALLGYLQREEGGGSGGGKYGVSKAVSGSRRISSGGGGGDEDESSSGGGGGWGSWLFGGGKGGAAASAANKDAWKK